MTRHTLSLYSPNGSFLAYLQAWVSIDVTLSEREPGPMTIVLMPAYRDDMFQRDCRIVYERALDGTPFGAGQMVGDTAWLLTGREHALSETGEHRIVLICDHPTSLLGRRIIAYDEGSTQADKNDIASDVIYDYIRQQFVTATDTARNLSTDHFLVDDPGVSFGPTVAASGSMRNLLDVLNDAAQQASAQGTYIGFEVYTPTPPGPFHARIYHTMRGADHTQELGSQVRLGPFSANMSAASMREDWSSAVSFVYAGGAGKGDEQLTSTAEDTTLSAQSPFGRFEHFLRSSTDSQSTLDAEVYRTLRDFRPQRVFEGGLNAAAEGDYLYGIHYTWGDLVIGSFRAENLVAATFDGLYISGIGGWTEFEFPCRVNPVHIQVARLFDPDRPPGDTAIGSSETIEVHLQSVESF